MKKFLFVTAAALMATGFAAGAVRAEVAVGGPAPEFTLTDIEGEQHSLSDYEGQYVVLEWYNPDCPFVVKHYQSHNMQDLQELYTSEDVAWLMVNTGAPGKQGVYSPEEFASILEEQGAYATALLLDQDGAVGRLYGAQTTPHMYVIDPEGTLIYQGAIDDTPSVDVSDIPNSINYVAQALDESMQGEPVSMAQTKSYGCSVKY